MNFKIFERLLRMVAVVSRTMEKAATLPATGIIPGTSQVIAVAEFDTDGYSRITGTCRSNVVLNVIVYQGGIGTKNYATTIPVPASAAEGAGAGWSVEVISQKARIDIQNPGAVASTSCAFEATLRSIT